MWVSQFNMVDELYRHIDVEIKKARKKKPALIRIKVNNLEEQGIIEKLYEASNAGVTVQLIVRSICCLVPGVEGKSTNITVKRIVGRYLEHTRLFIFGDDNDAVVALGSSDLMTRNLYRRIEVVAQVRDTTSRKELIDYFSIQWADTVAATEMLANTEQTAIVETIQPAADSQENIYKYLQHKL